MHLYQQSRHLVYDRATSNLTLNITCHLGRRDRATRHVAQARRSKWRDCVEGSVAIVLWEGRDCVAGSGTPAPPATVITTPIMYATKKAIYVFTTFYIYLILRCSTVGRWRSLVLSLNGIGIASRVETRQKAERSGRGRRINTMCVTGGRRA